MSIVKSYVEAVHNAEKLIIQIDGKPCTCKKGEYLLDIAKRNDIFIPTLCYREGLESLGACRLCIVEVVERGRSRVVVSCIFPVEGAIEVFTQSDKIRNQRAVIITLLAHLAPQSETIAQMAAYMGIDLPRLKDKPGGKKCILCGRCTTACEQLGAGAITKVNRGTTKEIATPYHRESAECIGCTSCAQVCPTGQIEYAEDERGVEIWGKRFEYLLCSSCGKPTVTAEHYKFMRERRDVPKPSDTPLCDECEKRQTAKRLLDSEKNYEAMRLGIEELM